MDILVLGDSHSGCFKCINPKYSTYDPHSECHRCISPDQTTYLFDVRLVEAASARGLRNPDSKTQSRRLFSEKLATKKNAKKVLIVLGEVDCGYLAYISAKKYNTTVEEELAKSCNNLVSFVEDVVIGEHGFKCEQVMILGSFLPAIKDTTFKKCLHALRPNVEANQRERTVKTLFFNDMLKKKCKEQDFTYFDITSETMGDDGTIKDEYLHPNVYNHHLDITKIWGLLLQGFSRAASLST